MSALTWAHEVQSGTPIRWRALEVAAFEAYPRVQEQLDPGRKYGRVRASGSTLRDLILAIPLMVLIVALFFAPIAGFATLVGDRFGITHPDPARTIPAAGVIFAVSLPLLLISFVLWLRAGRPKDTLHQYQSGIAVVLGAYSALLIQGRGSASNVTSWPLWIIPVGLVTLVGGVFFVLLLVASRRSRLHSTASKSSEPSTSTIPSSLPLERVTSQIDRLSPTQQGAVRADISAAIRLLAQRGMISPADGDWALGAELGKLALRMSQSRKRA